MKIFLKVTLGVLFLAGEFVVQGQFSAPGGLPPGFHHAVFDVLAGGPSFYGTANLQITNSPDQPPTVVSCSIAVLSGSMRLEVNSFETGSNVPPAEAAVLKQMRSIAILRPDKNRMYLLYPQFKSYVELAYSQSTGTDPPPPPKINKTALGKEAVGDQPCLKNRWDISEAGGEHYDLTVWSATNLGNFPVQIQLASPPALMLFGDVHMDAPDSSLFEPPADYAKYEGIQEIIRHEAEKSQNATSP